MMSEPAFFHKSFPFVHRREYLPFWFVELLVLVTLFEYAFEPFARNYDEHLYGYWVICLYHAGVVTVCYLTGAMILLCIRPMRWRILDELLFAGSVLLLIGIGNFLIRPLIYAPAHWQWQYLGVELLHAYVAGSLFYVLIIQLNLYLFKRYQNYQQKKTRIHIRSTVASDSLTAEPREVLCIKSDGNYAVFYLNTDQGIRKQMIRQTLDSIEQQLSRHHPFLRTHRTYIVNMQHVSAHRGNAAGYQLSLSGLDFTVPVSRNHVKRFDQYMEGF